MRPFFVFVLAVILGVLFSLFECGCSAEDYHCTSTCIGKGWAQTAAECSDAPFIRTKSCGKQRLRAPELGEQVTVVSSSEERTTLVISVLDGGAFAVGGPQTASELGSGVYGSDHSLLGIVESVDGDLSICSEVEDE